LSKPQKEYIEEQIKDLGYNDNEKEEVIGYFNDISSYVSKTLPSGNTVLEEFFNDVNLNYQEYINPNIEEKRVILLSMLSIMYYSVINKDPDTDEEDES